MAIRTTIKPTANKDAKAAIAKLKARRKKSLDTKPVYRKIGIMLDAWVLRNFKTEGGNVGGWKPFKIGGRWLPGRGLDPSAKLLQDTGVLRASFVPFHTLVNVGIGSDLPYAKPHEKGTKHTPKRRMLPQDKDVRTKIKSMLFGHIKEAYKK